MKLFDLLPLDIRRPEKISWFFPPQTTDLLAEIKSKSLRGFLKRTPELLSEHGLVTNIAQMSKEQFRSWLPYYTEKMEEQSYEILATPEWFDLKMEQQKNVYSIFIHQGETLVAALIFTHTPENNHSSIAFRANDRLDIFSGGRSSIGALLDYAFLEWSLQKKCTSISAGRTRNAFGVINTLGNLDYKLRFGYLPKPTKDTVLETSVPLTEAGCAYFYGLQNDKLLLIAIHPVGSIFDTSFCRYITDNIGFKEITY
jgi:hypothetical protein